MLGEVKYHTIVEVEVLNLVSAEGGGEECHLLLRDGDAIHGDDLRGVAPQEGGDLWQIGIEDHIFVILCDLCFFTMELMQDGCGDVFERV